SYAGDYPMLPGQPGWPPGATGRNPYEPCAEPAPGRAGLPQLPTGSPAAARSTPTTIGRGRDVDCSLPSADPARSIACADNHQTGARQKEVRRFPPASATPVHPVTRNGPLVLILIGPSKEFPESGCPGSRRFFRRLLIGCFCFGGWRLCGRDG